METETSPNSRVPLEPNVEGTSRMVIKPRHPFPLTAKLPRHAAIPYVTS